MNSKGTVTKHSAGRWMAKQKRKGEKGGVAGAATIAQSEAFVGAAEMIRQGKPMAEVTASFRSLRVTDRFAVKPLGITVDAFHTKYAPRDRDVFRTTITEASVLKLQEESPKLNPAHSGLTVGDGEVHLRFDNMRDVSGTAEVVAILQQEGFTFPTDRKPADYVIFNEFENPKNLPRHCKFTATVVCDARAVGAVEGTIPLSVDGHSIVVSKFTPGAMRDGLVHRVEGSMAMWVKQQILLDIPMQSIFWQAVVCMEYYGIPCRKFSLDDGANARRHVTTDSVDFALTMEYFEAADAQAGQMLFDQLLVSRDPVMFTGASLQGSILVAPFALKQGLSVSRNDKLPIKITVKVPNGWGDTFKELVEASEGDLTRASVVQFIVKYLTLWAPAMDTGRVEPECYSNSSNVNFNFGVSFLYPRTEFKAALELYARFGTRSPTVEKKRLDFLRKDNVGQFAGLLVEVSKDGRQMKQYPECGMLEEKDVRDKLDKRGVEDDLMTYFQQCWESGFATSPHEGRLLMQERAELLGQLAADPPMGSTPSKLEGDSRERMSALIASDPVGSAMLLSDPVCVDFWRHSEPYIDPATTTPPSDPMLQAMPWAPALHEASPELILPPQWMALEVDEALYTEARDTLPKIMAGVEKAWCPAPATNCLPIQPRTVPTPERDLAQSDLRTVWMSELWGTNPAVCFRAIASCIQDGVLVQAREMSGLVLSPGPTMIRGESIYWRQEPKIYTTGVAMMLKEADARLVYHRLWELVDKRGVLLAPALHYRDEELPPHLITLEGKDEDKLWYHLKSHLWWEANHFGYIISYLCSGGHVHQIPSAVAGGIYLVSTIEQNRRLKAGINDSAYTPLPYEMREQVTGERVARETAAEAELKAAEDEALRIAGRTPGGSKGKGAAGAPAAAATPIPVGDGKPVPSTGASPSKRGWEKVAIPLTFEKPANTHGITGTGAATDRPVVGSEGLDGTRAGEGTERAEADAAMAEEEADAIAMAMEEEDEKEAAQAASGARGSGMDPGGVARAGGAMMAKQLRDKKKARDLAKHGRGGVRGPVENAVLLELRARAERESWSSNTTEAVPQRGDEKPASPVARRLTELADADGSTGSGTLEDHGQQTAMDEGDNPGQELGQALTDTAMATAAGMGDKLSDGEGEKSPGKDQVTGRDGLDSDEFDPEKSPASAKGAKGGGEKEDQSPTDGDEGGSGPKGAQQPAKTITKRKQQQLDKKALKSPSPGKSPPGRGGMRGGR